MLSRPASYPSLPRHILGKLRHVLSMDGFLSYLCSKDGDIFKPTCLPIYQDMTQPLNNYYINSSHNTYLVGDQLYGQSSVEGYIRCSGKEGGKAAAQEKGPSVLSVDNGLKRRCGGGLGLRIPGYLRDLEETLKTDRRVALKLYG